MKLDKLGFESGASTRAVVDVNRRTKGRNTRRPRRSARALLGAAAALMAADASRGGTVRLTGTATNNSAVSLTTNANWAGNGLPMSGDDAEIATGYAAASGLSAFNLGIGLTQSYASLIINDSAAYNIGTFNTTGTPLITLAGGSTSGELSNAGGAANDLLLLGSNVSSGTNVTFGNYVGAGAGTGTMRFSLGVSGNFDVVNAGVTATITQYVSGLNLGIVKTGAGTVTMTSASTTGWFTGALNVSGGTYSVANYLAVGGPTAITSSNLQIGNNATLQYVLAAGNSASSNRLFQINTGGATIDSSGAGYIQLGRKDATYASSGPIGFGSQTASVTLTLGGSSPSTLNGICATLSDNTSNFTTYATSVAKTGQGFWALTALTNTYTGGTTITGGTLDFFNANSLGTGNVSIGAATLEYGNVLSTTASATLPNNVLLNDPTSTIQVSTNSAPAYQLTIATAITGNGALNKTGPGMLRLSGSNTYGGGTNISSGQLVVFNSTGSGTGPGQVTVGTGATLAGTGTIAGGVTVLGTIAPGLSNGSIGVLSTGPQRWNASGGYTVKFAANGASNDQLTLSGLTLPTSGLPFVVSLTGLNGDVATPIIVTINPATPIVLATDTNSSDAGVFGNAIGTRVILDKGPLISSDGSDLSLIEDDSGGVAKLVLTSVRATPEPASSLLTAAAAGPLLLGQRRPRRAAQTP